MSELIEISRGEYIAAAINSIKKKYPDERQISKGPSFALQYDGTINTLMRNNGFSRPEATSIFSKYHERYKVSTNWVKERIRQAAQTGYVTAAFGLRVRTPLLEKTVLGGKNTPYEATAEARTAGNALGQSWCLLNCRAANAFMQRVWDSPYRLDIRPCAQIHDAIYILIKKDTAILKWVNDNLIDCMQWQDDPLLAHPTVKIGAELDVFYVGWHQPITLPNNIDETEIRNTCKAGAAAYAYTSRDAK